MDRYPYSPRLIRYCSGYSLSDPPCRVGAELVSLAIVKFLNSTYQSQISLLDKIEEKHPPADIFFCYTDYQSQVCLYQLVFRVHAARLYPFGKFNFVFRCQEGYFADLPQIHADRVREGKIFKITHLFSIGIGRKKMLSFRWIDLRLWFIYYVDSKFHQIHVKAVKDISCKKIFGHMLFNILVGHKPLLPSFMEKVPYVVYIGCVVCRIGVFTAGLFYGIDLRYAFLLIVTADDFELFIQINAVGGIQHFVFYY